MKRIIILLCFFIVVALSYGQNQEIIKTFTNYYDLREYFGSLYQQEKYKEAAAILEKHLDRFPDHIEANAFNLAFTYIQLEAYEKSMKTIQYALDSRIWFNIYAFDHEAWEPVKKLKNFQNILSRNEKFRKEAQKLAKPDLLVITPDEYEDGVNYPLFIALHGGSSNIVNFKESWKSEKMKKEFITAYVQSSLIVGINQFTWTIDMEISKKEIKDAYVKIIEKYPVDEKEIIIGGFSAGGVAALEIALSNSIPVTGFVVLCPGKPEIFDKANIIEMKKKGVRGTIITSEMDPRLSVQKEMVEVFKAAGLQYQFVVTPNIGHWFPDDLDKKIDKAINHIRYK